jgi:predicted AlkP superfamily phosphohydrolase/phosphomutase
MEPELYDFGGCLSSHRRTSGYRTGNHVPGGFYLGSGPAVSPGERYSPVSIMDLAPTIAELLVYNGTVTGQ